jgi:DNA-binding transcriptional MerR regulator/predicted transcriptional regulator YdeE
MLSIGEFARLGQVSPRTLRHYGDVGVLVPAHVDPATGYRSYELRQLSDLRRVLALRDLGVGLEQIRELTAEDGTLPVEQLRGMLRLRRSEISASIAEDQQRLRRVASYLDALERGELMKTIDVVVKETAPLRMAETTGTAPGYGHANIGPVFQDRLPVVWLRLRDAGVEPGKSVAYYEWPDDDGRVVVHLGFDIEDQPLPDTDEVRAVELSVVEVASALHRGPMDDISDTFEAVVRWIDGNGYRISGLSRELYLEWDQQDPSRNVTELQLPIGRAEAPE